MFHVSPAQIVPVEAVPEPLDLAGFRPQFLRDASGAAPGLKRQPSQELDHENSGAALFLVSESVEIGTPPLVTRSPVAPISEPATKKRRGPGRPKKRGRKKAPKPDGRLRVMAGPITMEERRDLLDAVLFARWKGRELNTTIDFQPVHLDVYPEGVELGRWFRNGIVRDVATFFAGQKDTRRKPLRWWGFGTRESYVGHRREHLHLVLWCPPRLREDLQEFLRRRFPGGTEEGRTAVLVGELDDDGVEYRFKQQAGNAAGEPRPGRPTAEVRSRWDGAAVASVYGKRYVISRTLDAKARSEGGWQQRRDDARAFRRIQDAARRARERGDGSLSPMGSPIM